MTDINHLIKLNIEMEGLLRVLADRPAAEAREMLAQKLEEYSNGILALTSAPAPAPLQEICAEEPETIAPAESCADEQTCEPGAVEQAAPAEPAAEAHTAAHAEAPRTPNTQLLKAFTLNDRFRFRRELFGGNDADFTETLTLLADMDSYDEAAGYLCDDMMWDPENPEVSAFLEILSNNMPR